VSRIQFEKQDHRSNGWDRDYFTWMARICGP
jgi:hypothetical protein